MPRRFIALLLLALATVPASPAPVAAVPAAVPLIARDALFGNPARAGTRISPDGRWLSWIAPRDGVLNVWVAPIDDLARARPLTAESGRPIRETWWAPDSRRVLFVNDRGGDENFLLYGVDVATGARHDYTPFDHARVKILAISLRVKDRILLGISRRDPHWQDVFSLDLTTGALREICRNDRYDTFVADADLNLRLAQQARDDGGVDWFRMRGSFSGGEAAVDDVPVVHAPIDDALAMSPLRFSADGRTLWWLDSRVADTVSLVALDVETGGTRVAAHDPRADIDGALFEPRTGALQAWTLDIGSETYVAAEAAIGAELRRIAAVVHGPFTITSRSDDDRRWVVVADRATAPPSAWLYERGAHRLKPLFVGRPALAAAPLVPMRPVTITARDGLALPSYLSRPMNARGPVPMVLLVHGGPWERDAGGFNAAHQWLANRGYAVLSVNFRGSTGFGKRFVAAGDREWGGAMQRDLLDAVDWAVARGVTTRDRVAIMGSSYGGYAALAGLAFTPGEFACGIDIVGPSNLPATLAAIPPWWASYRQTFHRRVGDPTTPAGLAMLDERSPLNSADRIVRPLLIGQGANDPRVGVAESDRIVAALKSRGTPVTYLVFPDEGHGFERPENRLAFLAVAENFLQRCLGGRAEPIGEALRTSSAEVRDGAEAVPGLAQALSVSSTARAVVSNVTTSSDVRVPSMSKAASNSATSAAKAISTTDGTTATATLTTHPVATPTATPIAIPDVPVTAPALRHHCAEIQLAADGDGSLNQVRASSTSAAMPACSAASDP